MSQSENCTPPDGQALVRSTDQDDLGAVAANDDIGNQPTPPKRRKSQSRRNIAMKLTTAGNAEPDEQEDPERKNWSDAMAELRLNQDFDIGSPIETVLTNVRVGKPHPQDFCRAHSDPTYSFNTAVLETQDDREVYLVSRALWDSLASEIIPVQLVTAINRQGTVFLWQIKLPRADGRWNPWNQSLAVAVETAKSHWVRVNSNMSLGAYEVKKALAPLQEPVWPDKSFEEILELAFKNNFIQSPDHPVLKRLRGEI